MNSQLFKPFIPLVSIVIMIGILFYINNLFYRDGIANMVDKDGDGYVALDKDGKTVDCRDDDPRINPGAVDFPNNSVDEDCTGEDSTLPQPEDLGGPNGQRITLYHDFVFTGDINTESITSNSWKLLSRGKFVNARLYIKADASELNSDPERRHTVYFYIDNGLNGGHLATYQDGILTGTFSGTIDDGEEFEQIYDMSSLRLGDLNSTIVKDVDALAILNENGIHYLGAFVATGRYGILRELAIEYDCMEGSECSLAVAP